uniref:Uncharacterized protein n=1 Tax=Ciona savignyi TaxID=51511 RepID=H2Y8F7_CIOSA
MHRRAERAPTLVGRRHRTQPDENARRASQNPTWVATDAGVRVGTVEIRRIDCAHAEQFAESWRRQTKDRLHLVRGMPTYSNEYKRFQVFHGPGNTDRPHSCRNDVLVRYRVKHFYFFYFLYETTDGSVACFLMCL